MKKQKGSRLNKKATKEEKSKSDEIATYGPPNKQQHFKAESTTGHKKKK